MATRDALLSYLAGDPALHRLAANAGLSEEDESNGYGPVLDTVMHTVAGDVTATEYENSKVIAARAVAKYYALDTLQGLFAERVATSIEGAGSRSDQQAFTQVGVLLERAGKSCEALGYSVGTKAVITSGYINLDFLEPSLDAAGVG